jgi:hypothetical protein
MKSETLIALGILFFVVCGCLSHTLLESFRGGGGRRGGGRRGGGRRGGGRRGGGGRGYLHRFRRRNHGGWYRRPLLWGNWNAWPSFSSYWPLPCNCKRGCTADGCAFPGTGLNDCVWASDCNCCGLN